MSSVDSIQIVVLMMASPKCPSRERAKPLRPGNDQEVGFYVASHDRQRAEWGKQCLGEFLTLLKIPLKLSTHLLAHAEHAVSACTRMERCKKEYYTQ